MRSYEAGATIAAPPEKIWAILVDADGYSLWDSGVHSVTGRIAPGEKITVRSHANPGRAFPVKVTEFEPARGMTWSGGMPLGLFKGVRTFTLAGGNGGATRFTMREEYSGPLLPLCGARCPTSGSPSGSSPTASNAGRSKARSVVGRARRA